MKDFEKYFNFYALKGNLEILKYLNNSKKPEQFKNLRNLINPNTTKKFSSKTIAQRLNELEEKGIIGNVIIIDKRKKYVGYTLTDKGKNTYEILKETAEKLEKITKEKN